jgi:hypothetical protein
MQDIDLKINQFWLAPSSYAHTSWLHALGQGWDAVSREYGARFNTRATRLLDQLLLHRWCVASSRNAEPVVLPPDYASVAIASSGTLLEIAKQLGRAYLAPAVKVAILATEVRQWQRALGNEYEPVADYQGTYPGVAFRGPIPISLREIKIGTETNTNIQAHLVLTSGIKLILASFASVSASATERLAMKFPRDLVAYDSLTFDREVAASIVHWCQQSLGVKAEPMVLVAAG